MKFSILLTLALSYTTLTSAQNFRSDNADKAEQLQKEFAKLNKNSPCENNAQACVEDQFAQCVGGKFQLNSCGGGDLKCVVLPLVNKPGTSITCSTEADRLARLADARGKSPDQGKTPDQGKPKQGKVKNGKKAPNQGNGKNRKRAPGNEKEGKLPGQDNGKDGNDGKLPGQDNGKDGNDGKLPGQDNGKDGNDGKLPGQDNEKCNCKCPNNGNDGNDDGNGKDGNDKDGKEPDNGNEPNNGKEPENGKEPDNEKEPDNGSEPEPDNGDNGKTPPKNDDKLQTPPANGGDNLSAIQKKNIAAAKALQEKFDKLTPNDECNNDEVACVDKKFAQCSGGKFALTDCAAGTVCSALPLVLKEGTTVACTTQADRDARLNPKK